MDERGRGGSDRRDRRRSVALSRGGPRGARRAREARRAMRIAATGDVGAAGGCKVIFAATVRGTLPGAHDLDGRAARCMVFMALLIATICARVLLSAGGSAAVAVDSGWHNGKIVFTGSWSQPRSFSPWPAASRPTR